VLSGEEEGLEDAQPHVPPNADTLLQHLKKKLMNTSISEQTTIDLRLVKECIN
jgi:hypothetical protein